MSSSYRMTLDKWLSSLDVKADKVLDIGGSQLPIKGRTKSWDVNKYLIADLPNPHEEKQKADLELDLNMPLPDMNHVSSYDLIFCLEVFDYIHDPMTAMINIQLLIKKGGSAWVSFPTFYPHHNPIGEDALCYKEYGIRKLAYHSGLEVKQIIKRRPQTDMLLKYFSAEGLRAAKGYDHNVFGFIVEFKNEN